jgi:hypothetical protein
VLDYFIGIIPFFFVSTIYNRNENLSRGFVRKMQKYFLGAKDGKTAMTEANDGYSSHALGAHGCTPDMHKRLRNLYKNGTKNCKKVVA